MSWCQLCRNWWHRKLSIIQRTVSCDQRQRKFTSWQLSFFQWFCFNIKTAFLGKGIYVEIIRRSWDHLIVTRGSPLNIHGLVGRHLYIEKVIIHAVGQAPNIKSTGEIIFFYQYNVVRSTLNSNLCILPVYLSAALSRHMWVWTKWPTFWRRYCQMYFI